MGMSDILSIAYYKDTYLPATVDGAFVHTFDRRAVIEDAAIGFVEAAAVSRARAPITDRAKARIVEKL